jgi:hypothetical protein
LDILAARWYVPSGGRFISRDRAGYSAARPSGANRYTFSSNSPTDRVDPSGRSSLVDTMATTAIVATLASLAQPTRMALAAVREGTLPDAIGYGSFGGGGPEGSMMGSAVEGGAEIVFSPRLHQVAMYVFGGWEGSMWKPDPYDGRPAQLHGEFGMYQAYYYHLHSMEAGGAFHLHGLSLGHMLAAYEEDEDVHEYLFGTTTSDTASVWAFHGKSGRVVGPVDVSDPMNMGTAIVGFEAAWTTASVIMTGNASSVGGYAALLGINEASMIGWISHTWGSKR